MVDVPGVGPAQATTADAGANAPDGAKFGQEMSAAKAKAEIDKMGTDMMGMLMNSMLQQMLNNGKGDEE